MKRVLLFFCTCAILSDAGWQRNLEKDGIVIETRPVAGSAYKEFKATMIAKTTLARVLVVMQDIKGYVEWMKDCKEAKRIKTLSASSGIVYSLQSTPWPITEREAVVQYAFRKTATPPALSVSLVATPTAIPENPGKVRIQALKGYWQFSELGSGLVHIVYSLHSEPGGNLPAWASAGMVAHLPYETLLKLRGKLEGH